MAERSRYQQKIISNYYKNRDAISLQRVQEMVTELYLATGKKRAKIVGFATSPSGKAGRQTT